MPVGGGVRRQVLLVIADTVSIEKRLIHQIFGDENPGDGVHQRGVGARADGDPFVLAAGGGVGIAWVDDDHACLRAFPRMLQMIGNAGAAHACFRRVIAEHHHQFGIDDV